ncbi:ABC-2 transporter permease [Eisenbergiella sp.]
MKSMILKDIYNITHNMRSMALLLVMFIFIMLPQGGASSYIITSCVLCSMMVITTFSFDNISKWEKYALVMPVTKQDLVGAKFIVLLIFTAFGAVSGLVLGIIGGLILGSFHPADPAEWLTTAAVAGAGICVGIFFGSIVIPLLFRFGAEKARILSIAAFLIPVVLGLLVYKLLSMAGVVITDKMVYTGLCIAPFVVVIWTFAMFWISCRVFAKQEI